MRKLGVTDYDRPAPWVECDYSPKKIVLPLSQHLGAPAEPVVQPGDRVRAGQLVADIPADKLAARIHSSIAGVVTAVNGSVVIEQTEPSSK